MTELYAGSGGQGGTGAYTSADPGFQLGRYGGAPGMAGLSAIGPGGAGGGGAGAPGGVAPKTLTGGAGGAGGANADAVSSSATIGSFVGGAGGAGHAGYVSASSIGGGGGGGAGGFGVLSASGASLTLTITGAVRGGNGGAGGDGGDAYKPPVSRAAYGGDGGNGGGGVQLDSGAVVVTGNGFVAGGAGGAAGQGRAALSVHAGYGGEGVGFRSTTTLGVLTVQSGGVVVGGAGSTGVYGHYLRVDNSGVIEGGGARTPFRGGVAVVANSGAVNNGAQGVIVGGAGNRAVIIDDEAGHGSTLNNAGFISGGYDPGTGPGEGVFVVHTVVTNSGVIEGGASNGLGAAAAVDLSESSLVNTGRVAGSVGSSGTAIIASRGSSLTLSTAAGTGVIAGAIDIQDKSAISIDPGTAASVQLASVISGFGSLIKTGANALVLAGVNRFDGTTTVSAGELDLAAGGSLASSARVSLAASGAVFDVSGAGAGGATTTIQGLVGVAGSAIKLGAGVLSLTERTAATYAGAIVDGGVAGGTGGGLVVNGAALTLTGTNTYTGKTQIYGELDLAGTAVLNTSKAVTLKSAAAVFDISQATGKEAILNLAGMAGSHIGLGANSLKINDSTSATFSGIISDGGVAGGTGGSLIVKGAGASLNLTGANTFTGGVTLQSGTLELGTTTAAGAGTHALTFAGSATLQIDAGAVTGFSGSTLRTFSTPIAGFTAGDRIDLPGLDYAAGATATLSGTTLSVTSGSTTHFTYHLTLTGLPAGSAFSATDDGHGHVLVGLVGAG